jgi:hypothetical protein
MAQSVEVEGIWFWDDDLFALDHWSVIPFSSLAPLENDAHHWKGLRYLFEGEVGGVYGGGRGQEMSAGAAR